MPRTLPASFSALIGQSSASLIYLMDWELSGGTVYYSSNRAITYNGHAYEPRIRSLDGIVGQYIDSMERDFSDVSVTISNFANDHSTNFPITALDAAARFEDRILRIHLLNTISGEAITNLWWGYTRAPEYDPKAKTVKISASFPWDSINLPVPKVPVQRRCPYAFVNETGGAGQSVGCPYTTFGSGGFPSCQKNPDDCDARGMSRFFGGWRKIGLFNGGESKKRIREEMLPVVLGVSNFKIRPLIYLSRVTDDNFLVVNFIVSGTRAGFAFDPSDLQVANVKLFGVTTAADIDFQVGSYPQTKPVNLTRYPDGDKSGHSLVAHAAAVIPISSQIKDQLDELEHDDIKLQLANGRKTALTGLPTENPVYQLLDLLTDEVYGLGLPISSFDATSYAAAASYAASRYQSRMELHEAEPIDEFIMRTLRTFHGYITFEGGKVHIKCKRNDETAVATFGTGGRKIHQDLVRVSEKDSSQLKNQATITYRYKNRQQADVTIADKQAQRRAGNGMEKPEDESWESFLYQDSQVDINGAIFIRESQQLNLFIDFDVPLCDALDIVSGDVIRVNSPDIPNNGSNYLFRVKKPRLPGVGSPQLVNIKGQIYKPATYADSADSVGTDILRTNNDTSGIGRPPDVVPGTLTRFDPITNDTGGTMITIRCTWSYPAVDQAAQQLEGVFAPYPIEEVALYVRYTDESINAALEVKRVKYPTTSADIEIDFYKNRSVEVYFVAIGHNGARAKLGYQADPTKKSSLAVAATATTIAYSLASLVGFTAGDYVICENEINHVFALGPSWLVLDSDGGGNRKPFFDTSAIAHPQGTEVSVAKPSYPSLVLSLSPVRLTYPVVTGFAAKQRHDGVLLHCNDVSAENQEKYYFYWSTDADAGTNPAKLGSATPTWYTTDPNTPPAGVNLIRADEPSFKVRQEDIGAPGTQVFARVSARNGKHNWSSTLSSLGNNRLGDDAVPTLSSAPVIVPKQIGFRVKLPLPSANMKTFVAPHGKVEFVLEARNAANAILGYVTESGSTYGTQVGEYRFDNGLERTQTYNLKKGEVLTLFPTISTLKVYAYITNAVGTSAASPVASLTVSTWEADSLIDDTAVPSGLSTPNIKYQNGVLVVKNIVATDNNNTLDHYDVVLKGYNSVGTFLGYIETTNWTFTASEATAKTNIGVAGKMPFNVRAAQLVTAFGANGQFKAYFYAINSQGTSLPSNESAAISIATIVDPVEKDLTAPANLPTPSLDFSRGLFSKMAMSAVTNYNTLYLIECAISDGTNSLNLDDLDSDTVVSGAHVFYPIAAKTPKITVGFGKKRLRKMFGQSASLTSKFRLTNAIGSTTSAASAALALSAVTDVSPSVGLDNILWNGHLTRLEAAGSLSNWQAYRPTDGNFSILDLVGKLRYQDAEHRARWQQNPVSDGDSNKRWMVQYIGDLLRGEYYSGYLLILADGNYSLDIDIFIATITGATRQIESLRADSTKNPINITSSLTANQVKKIEFEFRYATDADQTINTYFCLRLNSRVDAGLGDPFVYADEFQLNPGRTVGPFSMRRLREGNTNSAGPIASGGAGSLGTGEEFTVAATSQLTNNFFEPGEGGPGLGQGFIYTPV